MEWLTDIAPFNIIAGGHLNDNLKFLFFSVLYIIVTYHVDLEAYNLGHFKIYVY